MPTYKSRRFFLTIATIYGPAIVFLVLTLGASRYADIPIAFFSRDPTTSLNGHPLTGVQSNLGILVWWAAAAIGFFSYAVLRYRRGDATLRSFLLWSSVGTAVLTLDDFFLFHDELAVRYMKLDEKLVILGYGVLLAWHLFRFRRQILCSPYLLLLFSLSFFGLSVIVDFFQHHWPSPWRIFFEDGFKLLGIISWSAYLIRCCFQACAARHAMPETRRQFESRALANTYHRAYSQ